LYTFGVLGAPYVFNKASLLLIKKNNPQKRQQYFK
jgi:hypothetical protein